MSSRHEKEKAVNVQVILRCRPPSEEELRSNAPQVVMCHDQQREVAVTQLVGGRHTERVFTFDKVFGPNSKQKDLYDQAVTPIVNEVLEGFNCTIFAYGQTGTGKTYTMEGECKKTKNCPKGQLPPGAGVIPRAVKQIFDTLEGQHAEYSVKVTFLELYNEEITDLLAPEELAKIALEGQKKNSTLSLNENTKGGVQVKGLEEEIVKSADEIFMLLEKGSARRRTAETLLNKQSSRSHSLFSITIHIKEATPDGEELIKSGKLNLVDLAGSENISRSGARDGRAREAGEINKSLLTLGRVITALVEHLGHVPYRDSKLTRLLRDSLGGRTKTCIIATVSPSVHCLEETLSTLDYAHRAKNIKNRPEVNQKVKKSTLINQLYEEIERLKSELYCSRDKVGVYIPRDRYYQEEIERKTMAEQIEQMTASLEANQKQIEELQEMHESELQNSAELSKQLEATEEALDHTSKLLLTAKEELRQAHYKLMEKDFIISEQRKSENALAHQACVLRSDLEKVTHMNEILHSKIAMEEKLSATNRHVVSSFQADLASKLHVLSGNVTESIEQQSKQLKMVEDLCKSSIDFHDKAVSELRDKVLASQALYISHIESLQNVVRFHGASSSATLEDISTMATENRSSLDQLLAVGEAEAKIIFDVMQNQLSEHLVEIAEFTQGLRERFYRMLDETTGISTFISGILDKFAEDATSLLSHSNQVYEKQVRSLADFHKSFEEQSQSEEQKLLAEIRSLMSSHLQRQKEMVHARINCLGDAARDNKVFLDKHASEIDGITKDMKRKWEDFSNQAQCELKDGSAFSAAKHCRMELQLQNCENTVDLSAQQLKLAHAAVIDMCSKQVVGLEAVVRSAIESGELHDAEIASARDAAEHGATNSAKDLINGLDDLMETERGYVSSVKKMIKEQQQGFDQMKEEHSRHTHAISMEADTAFQQKYKDYEPTGQTPIRTETNVPSKATIESLRAMSMEALIDEFRENHPYESNKDPKSLIPRVPLTQLNSLN